MCHLLAVIWFINTVTHRNTNFPPPTILRSLVKHRVHFFPPQSHGGVLRTKLERSENVPFSNLPLTACRVRGCFQRQYEGDYCMGYTSLLP